MAAACHYLNNKLKAYLYADQALQYFKQTNNFRRVIDTETLMLAQTCYSNDFEETIEQYEKLIKSCKIYNEINKKNVLLNNFAFEYFIRKKYKMARQLYKESMQSSLANKKNELYLTSLKGYIHCCLEIGNVHTKSELFNLIQEGLSKAEDSFLHKMYFTLLLSLLEGKKEDYYHNLHKDVIPYLKRIGDLFTACFYEKEIYHYFLTIGDLEMVARISRSLIDNYLDFN
ncbi:hypothetical protein EV207_1341 [Scopulibacillus darangshiensis]|uniref:Uncharacterized protein n=1 Tax=Scopulibacillus darangshiensis TaxID=442528 RepID=A0A4R2NLY7_9BACL|nr:hypothetical protein [Scopulibacillus darangshiensis]TCP22659.1 hypothetical protein EV207_1341 [Scopulibacillus darangshiensis]